MLFWLADHWQRMSPAEQLQKPAQVDGQHVSALPFGQERVQALLTTRVLFCCQPQGFRHHQLRPLLAQWLGLAESPIRPGRMSYDLRRLRLHGLIERLPKTQRYRLTTFGLKTALFYSRAYQRLLRRGLSPALKGRGPGRGRRALIPSHYYAQGMEKDERPLHVFGMGSPGLLRALFERGVDSADSSSFLQQTVNKRYLHPDREEFVPLEEVAKPNDVCGCRVCQTFDPDYLRLEGELNNLALALHNLAALHSCCGLKRQDC